MNKCGWVLGCASALWIAGISAVIAQEPGEGGIVGTGHAVDGPETRFERPDFPDRVERFEPAMPELPSVPSTASDLFGASGGGSPAPAVTVTPPPK